MAHKKQNFSIDTPKTHHKGMTNQIKPLTRQNMIITHNEMVITHQKNSIIMLQKNYHEFPWKIF